jgi:hypothetical protein
MSIYVCSGTRRKVTGAIIQSLQQESMTIPVYPMPAEATAFTALAQAVSAMDKAVATTCHRRHSQASGSKQIHC